MRSITAIAPTLSAIMGIDPHALARGQPLPIVLEAARRSFGEGHAEKCLVYAADAIGDTLFSRHESSFHPVIRHAPVRVRLNAVFPPKTPVCFASIFTGAQPRGHGIRRYERPVLTCDTIFDALARNGGRVAIVAVRDCSMSIIFGGRDIDYFIEKYDGEAVEKTFELLDAGEHDFIVSYNQGYDDAMHKTVPESPLSLRRFRGHVKTFDDLSTRAKEVWGGRDTALMWMTDHGSHIDPVTGRGTHGERIPEDMLVNEFFGFNAGA